MQTTSEQKKVVAIDGGYESYDVERRILEGINAELTVDPCEGDAARIKLATKDADAVLVRESPINAETIALMRRCRIIARYGIGVDNVDLMAARERRIYVANVPDYGTEEVSDHALALLLSVARRTVTRDHAVRQGAWNLSPGEKMYRIAGKALGLVGYGRIARALERKLRGLGVTRVLVYDPLIEASALAGVEHVDLDTLCAQSDFISLHAPLTQSTSHLIDSVHFALMKPTTILVNTARGGLIDETVLIEALRTNSIFGAGIDVFEREPPNADHPLFKLTNVVLSDHTAWYSQESVADLQAKAAEEVARVLKGEPPKHWVNRWNDEAVGMSSRSSGG
ncbi:MAG TPA: C-terminal binding protein [Chthoniobacterales bacterium]|nr:C-terminal binding protein [Chthoniobacterales bacterium]